MLLQAVFGTHAPQLPVASQTWPAPQLVPAVLLLPSTHRTTPVEHSVMPFRQPGLGLVVHATLAVHDAQFPPGEHTRLVPHTVPGARFPESMQVCTPVVHEVTPSLQAGFGLVAQP